jgi:dimethylaniline monooxygenase (N-oxide forming)
VPGFKAFTGARTVLLNDGSSVDVDAVIFCTGYALDFGILPELEMDGACGLPLVTAGEIGSATQTGSRREPHIPRLYHMVFPPKRASSIAVLSWMSALETAWTLCDLVSMAVAQIWAAETARELGLSQPADSYRKPAILPSKAEMDAEVDSYHVWWRKQWRKEPSMHPGYVRSHTFLRFLHEMAGTAMYDNVDHALTFRRWRLLWKDRQLYTWLVKGPANSYSWRIFDTNPLGIPGCGRRSWPDARKAVEDAVSLMSFSIEPY